MSAKIRKRKNYSSASILARKEKKKIERTIKFGTFMTVVFILSLTVFLVYSGLLYAKFWLIDDDCAFFANSDVCAWFEKVFNLDFYYVVEEETVGQISFITYSGHTEWIEMYGRYVLLGVINLLACFCFRRGKEGRISGGNIFICVLAFLAVWFWFILMDFGDGWLTDAEIEEYRVVMICDVGLLLYSVFSFITLCFAHKIRLFESSDNRINCKENGKTHTGVAVVAFLITWKPLLLPIIFFILLIVKILRKRKQANIGMEEAWDENVEEDYGE